MGFEQEHEKWIKWHLNRRQGERKDALKRGHGYGNRMFAERIWWSLTGHFHGLHPEYEVMDWRGRSYFVDFMWIVGALRFAFEIMDYGSHGKDRTKYRLDMNRSLFLQSQHCNVVSIPLDEMKDNHSFILALLQNMLAPYLGSATEHLGATVNQLDKAEKQLIRYAVRNHRIIRPVQAAKELELHKQTVIKYCRELVRKGKLRPVPSGTTGKIYQYEFVGAVHNVHHHEWG